ncbi:MAG: 4Fe-4S dicluster domain-containing protein [Bacillota bacterium]|nr:4Fe-4S dicluster domain-containing protein [Bacillota bacterium]
MVKYPGKITGFALKHLLKKPATIAYPAGGLVIDKKYRGKIAYDADDCIGCNLCVRDCPAGAIKIVNVGTKEDKKFECYLNVGHCIFCAQCVDSCRKGCLSFTPDIELAVLNKEDLTVKL